MKIPTAQIRRGITWLHDTIFLAGLVSLFLFFGGAKLFGYYYGFELIPIKLTESVKGK